MEFCYGIDWETERPTNTFVVNEGRWRLILIACFVHEDNRALTLPYLLLHRTDYHLRKTSQQWNNSSHTFFPNYLILKKHIISASKVSPTFHVHFTYFLKHERFGWTACNSWARNSSLLVQIIVAIKLLEALSKEDRQFHGSQSFRDR